MAQFPYPRYSPRNWLVIDWPFDSCSLPEPTPCEEDPEAPTPVCEALPIREAINTYQWDMWLPEVLIGIDEADEEIAGNYIRLAAIDFARRARVLQREVVFRLEQNVDTYPLIPWPEERILGILGMRIEDKGQCQCACVCSGDTGVASFGMPYQFNTRRSELTLGRGPRKGLMRVLVWAVPTETCCEADVFLYDEFHETINAMARQKYVQAMHFRDSVLVNSLTPMPQVETAILLAKRRALRTNPNSRMPVGSGMWQRGGGGFQPW